MFPGSPAPHRGRGWLCGLSLCLRKNGTPLRAAATGAARGRRRCRLTGGRGRAGGEPSSSSAGPTGIPARDAAELGCAVSVLSSWEELLSLSGECKRSLRSSGRPASFGAAINCRKWILRRRSLARATAREGENEDFKTWNRLRCRKLTALSETRDAYVTYNNVILRENESALF